MRQTHDAIRWALGLTWLVVLIFLLTTGNTGPALGLWVVVGIVVGLLLYLWQRGHRPGSF